MMGKIKLLPFVLLLCLAALGCGKAVKNKESVIQIKNQRLKVTIAASEEEKARGLSGQKRLDAGKGMLFVFPDPTVPGFWMKDMNFDLDIIWIKKTGPGGQGSVADITPNARAPKKTSGPETNKDTKLNLYSPKEPIDWVLEVNAGWSEKNLIRPGDEVKINP